MDILSATLSVIEGISAELSAPDTLFGKLTVPDVIALPDYTGAYEITPSQETQVLSTENKSLRQNITVNPIPSNYGLITWNGAILTVS